MPNSANSNSGSTGTTSAAAAEHRTDEASKAGSKADSEADFLAEQAIAARAAMLGVIGDLQANARTRWEQATDVRGWIDRHPWMAVGAASAAGFAAAAAVTPGPGQSLGEKLSSTIESVMPQADEANGSTAADDAPRAARQASQASIWGMLLEPVIEVIKVAAQNYFTAYVAGQAAAQATCTPDGEESEGDGSASAPSGSASATESTETNASAMA
ncbi:MAG TPA: hypothetical protein VG433_10170 [Pirellulales bacterium]|jgi:hypothetical protein|nr:hypothetical protein [Pirellulales bacterium]